VSILKRHGLLTLAGSLALWPAVQLTAGSTTWQATAHETVVPAALAGDTWLRHHKEDLMPYWGGLDALLAHGLASGSTTGGQPSWLPTTATNDTSPPGRPPRLWVSAVFAPATWRSPAWPRSWSQAS